jgi:stress response protein YsnF
VGKRPGGEQARQLDKSVVVVRWTSSSPGRASEEFTFKDKTSADAFTKSVLVAPFLEQVITVTETDEDAVVSSSTIVEDVVVHKGAEERVETIRDTLRVEEVWIKSPTERPASTNSDPHTRKH